MRHRLSGHLDQASLRATRAAGGVHDPAMLVTLATGEQYETSVVEPQNDQSYCHVDQHGVARVYCIAKLHDMRRQDETQFTFIRIPVNRNTAAIFSQERGIEMAHVRSISLKRADEPGIACIMDEGSLLIVDGNSRYVKRARLRLPDMGLWTCEPPVWRQALIDTGALPSSEIARMIGKTPSIRDTQKGNS